MSRQMPIFRGKDYLEVLEQLAQNGTLVDIVPDSEPDWFRVTEGDREQNNWR